MFGILIELHGLLARWMIMKIPQQVSWKDSETLWSCSRDQYFIQHQVKQAYSPALLYPTNSVTWNVYGDVFSVAAREEITEPSDSTSSPSNIFPTLFSRGKQQFSKTTQRSGRTTPIDKIFTSDAPLQFKKHTPVSWLHSSTTDTFDHRAFIHFANHYRMSGLSVADMCEHNSKVAAQLQGYDTQAQTWKILQVLFQTVNLPVRKTVTDQALDLTPTPSENSASTIRGSESDTGSAIVRARPTRRDSNLTSMARRVTGRRDLYGDESPQEITPTPSRTMSPFRPAVAEEISSDEDVAETQFLEPSNNVAFEKSSDTTTRTSMEQITQLDERNGDGGNTPALNIPHWDQESIITELLDYYAELGDVQMCVIVALVLDGLVTIPEEKELEWFYTYIEILQRLRLWNIATSVISLCPLVTIRSITNESTTIHTLCARCSKPMMSQANGYYACTNCSKFQSKCSFCHQIVRGQYSWCQTCGHGGHLNHMKAWFEKNTECPSGCGHRCHPPIQTTTN
eukprot:NODE_53_length_2750_cov_104.187571_g34_i0.p1 GENE.NODE_53_length_2750_cov_104.187571_g34_i0~~NODE_53_length_2750_cov_104.187571_g34_i0.p1  ORF type:complete len:512 (+),score=66.66 NODE_53_length_2750_cov_104.187571_g34_i0:1154-2689(+)